MNYDEKLINQVTESVRNNVKPTGRYVNVPDFESLEDEILFLKNHPYTPYQFYQKDIWMLTVKVVEKLQDEINELKNIGR